MGNDAAKATSFGEVAAVEPDPRMREVLAARSPGITVLDGRGEEMPLPGASADAVFVSTAWHWLDPAVDWLATNSSFIAASPADRETGMARCRAALAARAGAESRIEIPLMSWCWRADRLPRG